MAGVSKRMGGLSSHTRLCVCCGLGGVSWIWLWSSMASNGACVEAGIVLGHGAVLG